MTALVYGLILSWAVTIGLAWILGYGEGYKARCVEELRFERREVRRI